MITKDEEKKILEYRSKKYSYKKIGDKLNISKDTVMKVCKKAQQKTKNKENIQQKNSDIINYTEETYKILSKINNLLKSAEIDEKEKKKLEKIGEVLGKKLKTEVEDPKKEEREKITRQKDEEYKEEIQKNYIKKTIAEDLKNTIKEKNNKINKLTRNNESQVKKILEINKELSDLKYSKNNEINKLKNQIREITNKYNQEYNEKLKLKNDIDNLKMDIRIIENIFKNKTNSLDNTTDNFFNLIGREQSNLIKSKSELNEKEKKFYIKAKNLEKKDKEIEQKKSEFYDEKEKLINYTREQFKKINEENYKLSKKIESNKREEEKLKIKAQKLNKIQEHLEKNLYDKCFSFPCTRCKEPLIFDMSDPEINEKIKNLFSNYTHVDCKQKSNNSENVKLYPIS